MRRHHPTARGFTLLELLVAISIFALISAIAYGTLIRMLSDRNHLEEERAYWRALSLTFTRIEEDLSQARDRKVRDIYGAKLPAFIGRPTDTRALAPPSMEFTRGGVPVFANSLRSDLQRVAYRLEDGVLLRLTWPVLDRGTQTEPLESPLLYNIEEFQVRFFTPTGGRVDLWPSQGITDALPRGVEIRLLPTGRGEITRRFVIHG